MGSNDTNEWVRHVNFFKAMFPCLPNWDNNISETAPPLDYRYLQGGIICFHIYLSSVY